MDIALNALMSIYEVTEFCWFSLKKINLLEDEIRQIHRHVHIYMLQAICVTRHYV